MKKVMYILIIIFFVIGNANSQSWLRKGDSFSYSRDGVIHRKQNGNLQYLISKGINYRDKKTGHWKRHTFTLQNDNFGIFKKSYKADYILRTGDYYDDLYYFEYNNVKMTLKPIRGANHVKGNVKYAKVIFPNAYNNADVVRYINSNGIKEDIILKNRAAPDSFIFAIMHTAREIKNTDKGFEFYDKINNKLAFTLAKIIYYDKNNLTREAEYNIKKIGTRTFVKVKIDTTGMTYPITVDPTTLITGTTDVKDTYMDEATKNTNYDGYDKIGISNQSEGNRRRGLLWMDFSSISGTVMSLTCSLYVVTLGINGPVNINNWYIALDRCLTDWDVTEATWDSAKTGVDGVEWDSTAISGGGDRSVTDTALTALGRYPSGYVWAEISEDSSGYETLRNHINNFLHGTWDNYGWIMKWDSSNQEYCAQSEDGDYANIFFSQSEQANNPRLWLETTTLTAAGKCTLALGDTNAVYVKLDSIKNLYTSEVLVSMYNGNYNKWYRHDEDGVAYLTSDTAAWYTKTEWKGRKLILKSNARNTIMAISRVGYILYDTSYTFQDIGNISSGISINSNYENLFFVMIDTTGNEYYRLEVAADTLFNNNILPTLFTEDLLAYIPKQTFFIKSIYRRHKQWLNRYRKYGNQYSWLF